MKTINIGMIGGGFMCRAHTNAFKTIPYIFSDLSVRINLEAVYARNPEKGKALMERYGYRTAYDDMDRMLDEADVDLYDICLPVELHREAALKVIAHGKNIVCEKPLALSSEDAAQMTDAANSKGVRNYTAFNYRFLPAVLMGRKMITDGTLGVPRHMRVSYFQQSGADPDRLYDDIRYVRTPGLGSLHEIGVHAIDQMRFLLGDMKTVQAISATYTPERKGADGAIHDVPNDDMASAIFTFDGNATGSMECSAAFWGNKNHLSWEFYGSEGSIFWSLEDPNHLGVYLKDRSSCTDGVTMVNVTGPGYPCGEYWWPAAHNLGWEHGHVNMLAGVLENILTGQNVRPVAEFADGYRAAAVVDATRKSAKEGTRVDIL